MIHLCRARHVCVWVSAGKQSECHAVPGGGIQTHLGQYSDVCLHATINLEFWQIWKYRRFLSIFLGCREERHC